MFHVKLIVCNPVKRWNLIKNLYMVSAALTWVSMLIIFVGNLLYLIVIYFLWKAIYASSGQEVVNGMTFYYTLIYLVLATSLYNFMEMYYVWDFDIAFGNCNYFADYYPALNNGPTGFHTRDYLSPYESGGVQYGGYGKGWYFRLFQDPAFVKKVKQKWNEMYPFLQTVPTLINEHVQEMGSNPVNRNFERWPILGKYVWPQPSPYPATYEEEITRLKEFYSARLRWLNNELNKL